MDPDTAQDVAPPPTMSPSADAQGALDSDSSDARDAKGRFISYRLWVTTSLAEVAALVSIVYWPGQMDPDTLDELNEAATGHFTNWHTPILSFLWRGPYLLGFKSPGWILLVTIFALLVGFYLILRVAFRPSYATVIAILCCLFPPVLSWSIHVGRDGWFVAALLCSFGFSVRIVRNGRRGRRLNITAAVIFAFICNAAFQVALVPLAFVFASILISVLPHHATRRRTKLVMGSIVSVVLLYGCSYAVEAAINVQSLSPQQTTMEYDIALISRSQQRDLFPRDVLLHPRRALAALNSTIVTGIVTGIIFGPKAILRFPVEGQRYASLQNRWISVLEHHPQTYLDERFTLGKLLMSIGRPSYWVYQYPPYEPGFVPLSRQLQRIGTDYLRLATINGNNANGDWLYTVWAYVLILCGAVAAWSMPKFRRASRGGPMALLRFLPIAALAYGAVIVFTVPGLVYRYAYPMVVIATCLAPVWIVSVVRLWRDGKRADDAGPAEGRVT